MNPVKKTITWGRHQLTLETGEIARQADGAVLVNMDDTMVLVTAFSAADWVGQGGADDRAGSAYGDDQGGSHQHRG